MKTKNLLFGLIIVFSIQAFSQSDSSEKKEFVYKTVDSHEIKANIFLPNVTGLYPVLIYFHGGGFIFGNRDQGLDDNIKEKLLASKLCSGFC